MPIPYSLRVQKNPRTQQKKAYAYAIVDTKPTARDVIKSLVASTTITAADATAVIEGYLDEVIRRLKNGEAVHLGELGTLYPTLQSDGALKAENFSSAMIRGAKVRFRPGKTLKEEFNINGLDFIQTVSKTAAAAAAKAAKETAAANIKANNEALGLDDGEDSGD